MSDFTTVYFTWIKRGFNIPSTLVEFSLFGNEISIKFYGVIIAFGSFSPRSSAAEWLINGA